MNYYINETMKHFLVYNLQIQCQQQAQLFQRASEIHAAAKETVALAEVRFISHQHEWNFDQAWQDMLNHATMKVNIRIECTACVRNRVTRSIIFGSIARYLKLLKTF